jgi:sialic acid synthase SpsE
MYDRIEIVAELSGNHNGSKDRLLQLVKLAHESSASMIKVQCFRPDTITADSDHISFQITDGPWKGKSLYELYEITYIPWEWYDDLFDLGNKLGVEIFASVFDERSAKFISRYTTTRVKIASPEIIDTNLIDYCASIFDELIISTGMASKRELLTAAAVVKKHQKFLTFLQCVSEYPAEPQSYNLDGLKFLNGLANEVGISDHSMEDTVVLGAVALGAKFVEKHFIDAREIGGIDSHFSLEPNEFKEMVRKIRILEAACRKVGYLEENSDNINQKYRRSLFFTSSLEPGHILNIPDIKCIRPGAGLHPSEINKIIGKKLIKRAYKDYPIDMSYFQ